MKKISKAIPASTREKVIEKTIETVQNHYAFPEKGGEIADFIQERLDNGRYSDLDTVSTFCSILNQDLKEASQDLHLSVIYSPDAVARYKKKPPEDDPDGWYAHHQVDNYGLIKAEYLTGNVGYLDIRVFAPLLQAKDAAIAAMDYLSNCEALIVDVRNCAGGDPHLVQLFESYFFDERPKLLITLYYRESDSIEQIHTIPHLPGKRLPTIPLYILTSKRTFSGGEGFSYSLKHHGRATIVGEPSGGGAHTIDEKVLHDDFIIHIPTGYPTHPVTGSNWEGTGVQPDVSVPEKEALAKAHTLAIETLIERTSDKREIKRLKHMLERLQATYSPTLIPKDILSRYAGSYGSYLVDFRDSKLVVLDSRDETIEWFLTPISEVLFAIDDDDYNVRFDVGESDSDVSLVFLHWTRDKENPIKRTDE